MKKISEGMKHLYKQIPKQKRERIFTGDYVQVIYGKETGKRGKVIEVIRKYDQVVVEGVHMRKTPFPQGDEVEDNEIKPHPIQVSMCLLVDPKIDEPTSVKLGYLEDGTKVRVSKKTGTIIPLPRLREKALEEFCRNYKAGPLDTLPDKVMEVTYKGEDLQGIRDEFQSYLDRKHQIEKHMVFDE